MRIDPPAGLRAKAPVVAKAEPRGGEARRRWALNRLSRGVLASAVLLVMVVGVHEGELLRVGNRHAAAPRVEERPGRYLGYFENKFGEQLVFVHDDGELDATLLHGDVDWEPRRVADASGLPDVETWSSTRKSVRF